MDVVSHHPGVTKFVSPPQIHIWLGPGAHTVCYGLRGLLNVVISQPEDYEGVSFDVRRGGINVLSPALQANIPVPDGTRKCARLQK